MAGRRWAIDASDVLGYAATSAAPARAGPARDAAAVTDRTAIRDAQKRLKDAQCYDHWLLAARDLVTLTGAEAWRADDASGAYHADLLREQRDAMRRLREQGRAAELARLLTHSLYRNLADIQSPELYETALVGTKHLVSAYLDECEASLLWLAQSDAFEPGEQLRRFEQAERVFGRSALMLSGGATFGFYHFGVVKGLLEHGALPDVICGSSAGAMIAAGSLVLKPVADHIMVAGSPAKPVGMAMPRAPALAMAQELRETPTPPTFCDDLEVRSIHWSPYDRVGVVNADP